MPTDAGAPAQPGPREQEPRARGPREPRARGPRPAAPSGGWTPPATDTDHPRLSARSFAFALALLLILFATLNPIWGDADVVAWTENVWWSYVPIPLLVAGLLARERKLTGSTFALECMRLGFVKFAITFALANTIWAVQGPPPLPERGAPPPRPGSGAGLHDMTSAPAASPLADLPTGALTGVVRDAAGQPLPGALVYVAGGLDDLHFAPPQEPVRLTTDGGAFSPALAAVATWQPLELASRDGVLHTAVLAGDDRGFVMNRPILAGAATTVMFRRPQGLLEVSCSVHTGHERGARLLVLGHPYWSRCDDEGRFSLEGLPARELTLEVLAQGSVGPAHTASVTVIADEVTEARELVLADGSTPR